MSAYSDFNYRDLFAFNYPASTQLLSKVRSIPILGQNNDVQNSETPETMWQRQGLISFPTVATTVTIKSTTDQDKYLTGTGAWIVLVEGLDSNYLEQWETVNLAGSSVVETTKKYYRINALRSVYHGANKVANGTITATVASSVIRQITASSSIDYTATFTVPADHSYFPQNVTHNVLKANNTIMTIASKVYVPETNGIVSASFVIVGGASPSSIPQTDLAFPKIPAKADYWFDITYASTTNMEASTIARGLLVKNSFIPVYE